MRSSLLLLKTSICFPLVTQVTLQGMYSGWIPFFILCPLFCVDLKKLGIVAKNVLIPALIE